MSHKVVNKDSSNLTRVTDLTQFTKVSCHMQLTLTMILRQKESKTPTTRILVLLFGPPLIERGANQILFAVNPKNKRSSLTANGNCICWVERKQLSPLSLRTDKQFDLLFSPPLFRVEDFLESIPRSSELAEQRWLTSQEHRKYARENATEVEQISSL